MVLQAIKYEREKLQILDQLLLPHEEVYININTPRDAFSAIKSMQVRGAPAIAIVAALSLAVILAVDSDVETLETAEGRDIIAGYMKNQLAFLVTSRPTAVNLADAARKLTKVIDEAVARPKSRPYTVREAYIRAAEDMLVNDIRDNEGIGGHGASWIEQNVANHASDGKLSILTHCNTGSLATAGYGTALGVVRSLHARGILKQAFYTETRPYNQGSRLTGYELIHDNIPATLITDSMAAALFNLRKSSENISAVVVGADRVAANGDTANKIGTYSLAILARYHGIKFLVAAPRTTIDLSTASGKDIVIEERAPEEVTMVKGPEATTVGKTDPMTFYDTHTISIAAIGTHAWNPAFDVTPAELIDGIVTEHGVVEKESDGRFHFESLFCEAAGNYDDASGYMNGVRKATVTTNGSLAA